MAKSKIDFRHILIESLLIVFTVSLALTLSEWRNTIKERQQRDAALENIVLEIKNNKLDLEKKMVYHNAMAEKLGQYLDSDSLWSSLNYNSGIEAMVQIMEQGINNPRLQSGAWRSAELSGIVSTFDYKTLYVLSNVYQVQELGPGSTWKQLARLFSEPFAYDQENARTLGRMLQLGFGELYSQERSLVYSYENAIEELEKNGAK